MARKGEEGPQRSCYRSSGRSLACWATAQTLRTPIRSTRRRGEERGGRRGTAGNVVGGHTSYLNRASAGQVVNTFEPVASSRFEQGSGQEQSSDSDTVEHAMRTRDDDDGVVGRGRGELSQRWGGVGRCSRMAGGGGGRSGAGRVRLYMYGCVSSRSALAGRCRSTGGGEERLSIFGPGALMPRARAELCAQLTGVLWGSVGPAGVRGRHEAGRAGTSKIDRRGKRASPLELEPTRVALRA